MLNFLSKLLEPKTNGPETAFLLARLLDVKITATTLKKDIEEHPDYPSLLSISDVLNNYGIENLAIKTDVDKLAGVPLPCISHIQGIKSSDKYFTVIKTIADGRVHYLDPEKQRWTSIPEDDFASRFSGVVLLAGAGENAGEKDYEKNRKTERRTHLTQYILALCLPVLLLATVLIAFIQVGPGALLPIIFSLVTLAGCAVTALLLWYEVDQHNPALQQICSVGKKVSCGAVLNSKASKIAGISWSAIGFTYFMGILLLLFFWGVTNRGGLFIIGWINIFALPYIVFSIYYQWRVAKQWCVLCLGVQAMLALQFTAALVGGWHSLIPLSALFSPVLLVQIFTAFAIPFMGSEIALPALQKGKENKKITTKLQKLKRNRQIFEALLEKQKMITDDAAGMGITLGNSNAGYKLIKICNPYCGPCATAHKQMHDLLYSNPNVQVQILFTATNEENDSKTPPVKHLLAIAEKHNETITKHALDDWYLAENKSYEEFASKYPMNSELNHQGIKVAAMKEWCDKVKIEFTPTFFVAQTDENKRSLKYHQLPDMYSVNDLKYLFAV